MQFTLLAILFIIHWAVILFLCGYVFLRKNKKYDILYFCIAGIVVLHWIPLSECLVSYLEKKIVDNSYQLGQRPIDNPSFYLYQESNTVKQIIGLLFAIFFVYNVYTLFRIYRVPLPVIITAGIAFFCYIGYYRIQDFLKRKVEELRHMPPPTWVSNNTYLNEIYTRKITKPISHIDIFSRIACHLLPSCTTRQIDWNTFQEHCDVLREKCNPDQYDYVVGIESGGAFVARALSNRCKYIKVSKYDDNPNMLGKPIIKTRDDLSCLRGARVLLVDDQVSTGSTMYAATRHIIEECGASHVTRATLYGRPGTTAHVDIIGMPFVISSSPWGYSA